MTTPDATGRAVTADPERNLALELVRATEAAAISCSRYLGFGDKDQVARTEVNARWQAAMGDLFVSEGAPDEAWEIVPEVFNLEDQLAAARDVPPPLT